MPGNGVPASERAEPATARAARSNGTPATRARTVKRRARGGKRTRHEIIRTIDAVWARYRRQLRRGQQKLSTGALHDLRVQTRRLLVGLNLISPIVGSAELSAARKTLTKRLSALGPLRDAHVQLIDLDARLLDFPEMTPLHRLLRRRANRLADSAEVMLRKTGTTKLSQRMKAIRRDLGAALQQSTAIEVLRNSYQRTLRDSLADLAAVRADRFRDEAKVHEVRIALKHLRYGAETLPAPVRALAPAQLKRLKATVAALGRIHDIDVHLARLAKLEKRGRLASGASAAYRAELARCRRRLESELARRAPVSLPPSAGPAESRVDKPAANV